ncbi:hypothetical protein C0J52_01729 [Blattella germanica]|nr:hypothetical protein C0J52_01729 [Blattella germanica]
MSSFFLRWVVLTVSWFLSAALRWSHERIQQHSSLFHLAGWGIPAAQTIAVLVLQDVDADELTGACFVGNQNTKSLLVFVLAPQFLYLVLGASLLLIGFLALFRRRPRHVKVATAARRDKLEMTTMRLGIFGVLYIVPAACVVASLFYEYWSRDEWLLVSPNSRFQPRPSRWIMLLRLFMSLVVGITSAMWVWSPKSLRAWRRLLYRFGPYKQAHVKCHPIQYYAPPPQPFVASQRSHHGHKPHRKHRKHGSETTV